jgi:hypothetical protein
MAIFHCAMSVISRGAGRSSCAAAAYRAGDRITDERTGVTHDFTRKGGVMYSEIIAPVGTPVWALNRAELWNHVEQREDKSTRRATATTARELLLALPHELTLDIQITLTRAFGQHLVNNYGVAVDFSIHAPDKEGDQRNFHVHILISDRRLTDAGFAGKLRELSARNGGRAHLVALRKQWADMVNDQLETFGVMEQVDHRSYGAQSIDLVPTRHLGVAATALERRGVATELGNFNRNVAEINSIRVGLQPLGAEQHVQEMAKLELGKEDAEVMAPEEADAEVKVWSASGINPEDISKRTIDQHRKVTALSKRHKFQLQRATKTPNPSFVKMTNAERIKDAETKAKAARELRRTLARDHPKLGRGR